MLPPNQTIEFSKRESRWSLIFASLRYRDFRLVWLGSITEHFSEFVQIVAILWLVNEITHSPLMLTIVGASRYIAMVFFPIIGGVVADRVDRRHMLIATLLAFGLLATGLAVLTITGLIAIWHLIVFSLLSGVAVSFNHPARQAIVPNLVKREHLLNAISLDSISVQLSMLIAMPIAGTLMAIIGVWPLFVIAALGYLLAILWLLRARIPPTPPSARRQAPWHNLTEGFHYLRSHTIILGLALLYLIPWLTINTYTNFMPVFAQDILHIGAVGYGYLQGAPGLGAILGLIGLTFLTYYKGKVKLLFGAGVFLGIGLISFSASSWAFLSLPLSVVIGGMQTTFLVVNTTLIQNVIPDEVRGRVMSWREVAMGLGPAGSILFGAIAQYRGVPFSLGLLGGIVLFVSLLLFVLLPKFRTLG